MRLYIYLNKNVIKCIAANIKNISFDIDFLSIQKKEDTQLMAIHGYDQK